MLVILVAGSVSGSLGTIIGVLEAGYAISGAINVAAIRLFWT